MLHINLCVTAFFFKALLSPPPPPLLFCSLVFGSLAHGLPFFMAFQIVPNAGLLFLSFESSKRFFLYNNGYTVSPFSDDAKSDVDQSMSPYELQAYQSRSET